MSEPVPERPSKDLATVGDLRRAAEAERVASAEASTTRLIARVHPVLLALISVLVVCGVLGGYAAWVLSSAGAQTTQQINPVKTEVEFLKKQQLFQADQQQFMIVEQREGRADTRKVLDQVTLLTGQRPYLAPMAPLPVLDAGRP